MMNRQMIKNRVAELSNNGARRLSKSEFVEIGILHRDLPRGERSWEWLADLTGWYGTAEAYRALVKNTLKKEGYFEISGPINDSTEESSIVEKREMLFKERQKLRDERTAYNRFMRSDVRVDELKESIVLSVKELTSLPKFNVTVSKKNKSNCEGILMLSDWHIGQESNNFYNVYNVEVAKERVEKIVDNAIDYCNKFNVDTLHVLNLGDLIEGIINTNARIEQTNDAVSQLMMATELFAQALNKLQAFIPHVTYRSVTDNHSRAVQNKHESIAKENFNRLTDWYLEERLKGTSVVFMKDNLDIGLGRFTLKNGMKVAFMHGHEDSKGKVLQNLVGATHEWTDIVCMGHLHNPAEHVYQDMRLFINGSLCGTGPYALTNRLFTKPSQKMIIVDAENFVNLDISAE